MKINSTGFHDVEHDKKNSDKTQRIVVIGDSFTAAIHVERSKGWTQTLKQRLHKIDYPSVDVVNLGLDGTGTNVHLAILKQYLPILRPDVVILAFYKNDIKDALSKRKFRECYKGYVLTFQNEWQKNRLRTFVDTYKTGPFFSWLFNNLYLVRATTLLHKDDRVGMLLRSNYLSPSMIGIAVNERATAPVDIDGLFQQFKELSQQYNYKFLIIPVLSKRNPTDSLNILRHNVTELTLTELDIINISPIVQKLLMKDNKPYNDLFWKYDGHFNNYGNHVFGLAVAEVIDNYLKRSSDSFLTHQQNRN
ncbi:MAG: SGNH/GDSL hydrolase family protein [Thermodesulfobacteriota bacterium]